MDQPQPEYEICPRPGEVEPDTSGHHVFTNEEEDGE